MRRKAIYKVMSLLLVVILVCGMINPMVYAEKNPITNTSNGLSVESTSGYVGETVTVNVLAGCDGAIGATQGTLRYDSSALQYVGGDNTSGGGGNVNFTNAGDGNVNLLGFSISFKILKAGTHYLSGSATIYDFDENAFSAAGDGSITGISVDNPASSMLISCAVGNVGDTVSVSVSVMCKDNAIGATQGSLSYNPSELEYVGGENTLGESGIVNFTDVGDGTSNVLSFSVAFKILKAGTHYLSGTTIIYDFEENVFSVSASGSIYGKDTSDLPSEMKISNVLGDIGEIVTVDVLIKCNRKAIGATQGTLRYDSNVLQYVGGDNTSGGGGIVNFTNVGDGNSNLLAFSISFKILKAGTHYLSGSATIYDFDENKFTASGTGNVIGKEISPKHNLTLILAKPSTCIEKGNIEHWHCSICGKNYTNEKCDIEIEDVTLPLTDHIYGEKWLFDENRHWHECKICGNKIDEKNHSFVCINDREPTKDKEGIAHEECNCGYKKKSIEYINAEILVPAKPITKPDVKPDDKPEAKPDGKPDSKPDQEQDEIKFEIENNPFVNVPDSLKNLGFDTVEKVNNNLYLNILSSLDNKKYYGEIKTVVYDVILIITKNGISRPATEEEIEAKGDIDVVIPYPRGTNRKDYVFNISHMFTSNMNGMKAGDVELPKFTLLEDGIKVNLKGLSPVMVGYAKKVDESKDETVNKTENKQEFNNGNAPKTGDGLNMMSYLILMILSILFIIKALDKFNI